MIREYVLLHHQSVAGYGTVNRVQDKLRQYLHSLGIEGEYAKTIIWRCNPSCEGRHQKRLQPDCLRGGDGTVHEVLNGVYGSGVTLGIIPFGRHNLLAKALGITAKWMKACDVLLKINIAIWMSDRSGIDIFFISRSRS